MSLIEVFRSEATTGKREIPWNKLERKTTTMRGKKTF